MKICVQLMMGFSCFLLFCVQGFSVEAEANQEKLSIETFEAVAYSTEDKILYRNFIESNVKINGLFILKPSI